MEIRLYIIGIVIVCFCIPYIRCLWKRLNLLFKLKRICREKGYHLCGTHFFWFFGGKNGKDCDCTIETAEELFAVKLFGMPRRRHVLVFMANREFFTRSTIIVGGAWGKWIREVLESRAKAVPEYDFSLKHQSVPKGKKLRKILLVNPVPREMLMQEGNTKETILNPGDEIYGMEIMNMSWLLKKLR